MIAKIFLSWKKKPSFLKNTIYLTTVQLTNYLLPFLTLPYLTRVLTPEKFGIIAFYQSLTNFFMVICDYGYGLLAPREIALNRDDFTKLQQSFWAIFWGKIAIFFLVVIAYLIIAFFIVEVKKNFLIGFLFLGMILGQVLFPHWYFQGLETMGLISVINFTAKFSSTLFILLFVKKPDHFILVPLFYAMSWLVTGFLGFYLALRSNRQIFFHFPAEKIKKYLKDGFTYFIPNLSATSFQTVTPFVLGIMAGVQEVAIFSVVERIVGAIKFILHPIQQSLYPFLARKIAQENKKTFPLLRRILFFVSLIGIFIFIVLFLFSEKILRIIAGESFLTSDYLLKILAIHPFLVSLSGVLGIQILVNLGQKQLYAKVISFAAIANLVFLPFLVYFYQALGAVISITFAEILIFAVLFYFVKKIGVFNV